MKTLTEKQQQRIEKKRKKMAALLEITKLNCKDREAKALKLAESESKKMLVDSSGESPCRKRPAMDETSIEEKLKDLEETGSESTQESDSLTNKKPRLSGEEYQQLRKELRERKQKLKVIPRFRLKTVGECASLKINLTGEHRIPIFLSDVQHLLLYSLLGNHSPYTPARWCTIEKHNRVAHTVALVIEGLSAFDFLSYESLFSNITERLEHRLEIVTPSVYQGSVIEELVAVPLTGTQTDKLVKQYGSVEAALQSTGDLVKLLRAVFPIYPTVQDVTMNEMEKKDCKNKKSGKELSDEMMKINMEQGKEDEQQPEEERNKKHVDLPVTDKFSRTQLLLSPWQMAEENYPIPLKGELAEKYKEYIFTKDHYVEATAKSPMFGLDCEMCKTTTGVLELTKISLVDEGMNIVYDKLVLPENQITDYLTRYSGITRDMLVGVTTNLAEVQQALREILPADAILVGQSLNSDLHTLKMMHPYIIDTSVIFNITGDRCKKSKLQILAREFLGERIQEDRGGHCPTEDSMASLKLVKLKLANSVTYGDAVLSGCIEQQRKGHLKRYGTSIFKHVTKIDRTAAIVGNDEVMNEYSKYLKNSSLRIMDHENFEKNDQVRLVVTENNKKAVKSASEVSMEHAFTLCHVRLDDADVAEENIPKTFSRVNKWVDRMWQFMAVHGLLCVIFTGREKLGNGACFLNIKKDVVALH